MFENKKNKKCDKPCFIQCWSSTETGFRRGGVTLLRSTVVNYYISFEKKDIKLLDCL